MSILIKSIQQEPWFFKHVMQCLLRGKISEYRLKLIEQHYYMVVPVVCDIGTHLPCLEGHIIKCRHSLLIFDVGST